MLDLSGQTFGALTALWPAGRKRGKNGTRVYWAAMCACGKTHYSPTWSLTSGHAKSCGCLHRKIVAKSSFRHGMSNSPERVAYTSARQRCTNPNHPGYKNYGGRGIKFLFNSFEEFFAVVGPRPSADLTLDRINNDGNYEPGNCRWATWTQNLNNRRPKRRKADAFLERSI